MIFWGENLGQRAGCVACFGARENVAERCEGLRSRGKTCVERRFNANFRPCDVMWANEAATVAASHGAL